MVGEAVMEFARLLRFMVASPSLKSIFIY